MFQNYFRTAWRNLVNHKLYSILNIGGLSIGISVCMLIMVYVVHDRSTDRWHAHAGRIFYPAMSIRINNDEEYMTRLSYESGPILAAADPGVESFMRMQSVDRRKTIENALDPNKKFAEKNILLVDSNFFSFFSFHLMEGDPRTVLTRPFTMVISQRAAQKYFGKEDPVGKVLRYDSSYTFEITGVSENPPSNSSIDYDFLGAAVSSPVLNGHRPDVPTGEVSVGEYTTFFRLKDAAHAPALAAIAQSKSDKKFAKLKFSMNAFVDRHIYNESPANTRYRKIFPLVAVLILLLALINYMSLATARSAMRSKEVGVRKVLGAGRGKIIKQFYIESGLYAGIAFVLALVLFSLLRPAFYTLIQLKIDESFLYSGYAIAVFAGLLLVTVFISGSYPSLVLSAFQPVKVLYGRLGKQVAGAFVRKTFTVVQFSISVALIISSIVINRQLYFFRHMDTGIQREQVLMIPYEKAVSRHYLDFREKVANIPGVEGVAMAAAPVYGGIDMAAARIRDSKMSKVVAEMYIDENFIKLLGLHWAIPPADGRATARKGQVIINEEAISTLNLPANPIGEAIVVGRDTMKVYAVMTNFNYQSLHEKIEPLCLFVAQAADTTWYADNGDCLFVKIRPHTNIPSLLGSIRSVHDRMGQSASFEYQFLDEAFDAQYKAEDRLANIFNIFTVITIIIACLGLFGLASFSAAQRTKEMGIRKVLGADTFSLVRLVSSSFLSPVLVAILIAMPLAWLFMEKWLEDFPYRVSIGSWVFVIAGLATLLIAVITVSVQAIRVAIGNPVESLRSE